MANSRSIALTPEGLAQVRQRMAELPKPNNPEKKRWSQDDLAECASLGKKTVQRALKPESVDRDTIISIANALNLDPSTLVDPSDWNREPVEKLSISFEQWRQICRKVLKEKRQPNINELLRSHGTTHEVDDLFIPLGLVEKKQTRLSRNGIGSAEQGSEFYEPQPEEIVRRFDQADEFFETVIRGERSVQSRPMIVIGEPGAGKTTLLQKIATELPDELLPVWVSLADLRGCNLDQYLFGGTWWSQADKTLPPETGEEFKELFKTGQVCLLLDGVDEMSVPADQRGLSQLRVIYDQIKGWGDRVRVIMTCRVNVWEADPLFDKFEMYRNLQLAYPEQVEQYIDNFFSKPDLTVQSGEALKQELRDNDRVQDTVKNPLRLALLCHAFQCDGKLPDTQAGLYEMFLKSFYDIKKEQFYVEPAEREALHQALGELALEALDREQSNYRIDRSTAEKVLGHPEQKNSESFFYKALELGLLNKIGYVAEDPSQECYAFIHPTFQEYLAACSVKDWHYFLNHIPGNPAQGTYRVFENKWQNTILLWLSCPEEKIPVQQKEAFMDQLEDFDDGCGGFYNHLLNFKSEHYLVAFSSYSKAIQIIQRLLINFESGYINLKRLNTGLRHNSLEKMSKINEELIIFSLIELEEMHTLSELYKNTKNKKVIQAFLDLMDDKNLSKYVVDWFHLIKLHLIKKENLSQNRLENLNKEDEKKRVLTEIKSYIQKIDPDHPDAELDIDTLIRYDITDGKKSFYPHTQTVKQLLENKNFLNDPEDDVERCCLIQRIIERMKLDNEDKNIIVSHLNSIIQSSSNGFARLRATKLLSEFDPEISDEYITSIPMDLMYSSKDEDTQLMSALSLLPIENSFHCVIGSFYQKSSQLQQRIAIDKLIHIFQNSQALEVIQEYIDHIDELDLDRFDIINIFSRFLDQSYPDNMRTYSCIELIRVNAIEINQAQEILLGIFQKSPKLAARMTASIELAKLAGYDNSSLAFISEIAKILKSYACRSPYEDEEITDEEIIEGAFPSLQIIEEVLSLKYPIAKSDKVSFDDKADPIWLSPSDSFENYIYQGALCIYNNKLQGIGLFLEELKPLIKPNEWGISYEGYMYKFFRDLLLFKTKYMSYQDFYAAWHSSGSSEDSTTRPVGSTPQTQQLDRQFFNLQNQLTPTDTTYPLCLDLSSLQNLNDRAELCQELATLSYETIDPNFEDLQIPENTQNPAQLKTKLLHLRKHLNIKKLSLIFYNSDPTPELLQIFNVLKSSFSIAWVTDQPHPYRSFLPTAENLPQLIQTWLTELD